MKRNKWGPWNQFRREMNNLRSDVSVDYGTENMPEEFYTDSYPFINIQETDEDLIINADVPGFDKDEIKINLTEDELEINAEKEEYEDDEAKYIISRERNEERMYRKITLPERVSPDKALARLDKGISTITAPKMHDGSRGNYLEIQ